MAQFLVNPAVPFETGITDRPEHAGARVARMILRSLGLVSPLTVDLMYTYAKGFNRVGEAAPFWYIDPLGLQHTVADHDPRPPGGFPGRWRIYENASQAAANNQIRSTLTNYNVAAGCLIGGGKHWVCAIGYRTDNMDQLSDFIIHDPKYEGGGANQSVSMTLWNGSYTPVYGGTSWLGKIVEVGDPEPAADMLPIAPRPVVRPGRTILEPGEAAELAVATAFERYAELPHLSRALDVGRPGQAQLVARLDQRGDYYYLVPILADDHTALGAIMLDARYGDVLSVSASEEPYELWPVTAERAAELIVESVIPLRESLDTVANRLAALVARDCSDRFSSIRAELGSYVHAREQVVMERRELEPAPVWAYHPADSMSVFQPYYVFRTAWSTIYVHTHFGTVLTDFDLAMWTPLGA